MSWSEIYLGDIAEFRNGLNYTKANEGEGLSVINVKDFGDKSLPNYEELGSLNPHGILRDEALLKHGDIIFVRSNGNKDLVGRSLFINNPPPNLSFSAFCIRARLNESENPYFYAYFFRTSNFRKRISLLGKGTNISNLNQQVLKNIKVPNPSAVEKARIVDLVSSYDALIENNRRRIQLLEQAARLLYKEWFVYLRFPGHEHVTIKDGVPEGWNKKKIADVCETVGGGTPSTKVSEYWDGDITWVVPSDITKNDSLALLDSERKITEKGLRESSAKMVPPETILMTSRASVGFFALMDFGVCTNQGFINIIPYKEEMRMYLLFNLMSRVEEIRSNAKGTTFPEISKGRFRDMNVVVPPNTLVNEFAEFASDIIRQVRILKRSTLKLEKARDLLLPRLMNGEVAV